MSVGRSDPSYPLVDGSAPEFEIGDCEAIHVPYRRRSWYSLTFSDDDAEFAGGAEQRQPVENIEPAPVSCAAAAAAEDEVNSDASTDVGNDEDLAELSDVEVEVDSIEEGLPAASAQTQARRSLPKVSKQQRVAQLQKVVDEFCALDFDATDASSQHGLVLRMLVILKSLSESAIFYEGGQHRSEAKRFVLLGLRESDEATIKDITARAETHCVARLFRSAFDVLRGAAFLLHRPTAQRSAEEMEAMKLRRAQKRQRQRQERRDERATARDVRSAGRYKRASNQRPL
jgi:hypothetical protein